MTPYTEVTEGYYYVRGGDTARSVAAAVYGDQNKYAQLLKANPEDWEKDTYISVPGVRGRVVVALSSDNHASLIKKLYPGQPEHLYRSRFFTWNGGQERKFEDGDLVFLPER